MPTYSKIKNHARQNSGGRPTQERAEQIRDHILDAAQSLFFAQGYGSTSIEAVVKQAQISKRTFYTRFTDKSDLFKAVVQRIVSGLRPPDISPLFEGKNGEEVLRRIAKMMLQAVLTPQSLALHRLITGEASRFPELALMANSEGTRNQAIAHLSMLLQNETKAGRFKIDKPAFAAEQFMQMVIALPQRRALGLGTPMTNAELDAWANDSVDLFLRGCGA